MIFEFYPWKIDADVEATKKMYLSSDYAIDIEINKKFADMLTSKQKAFFETLGINPMKIKIEEKEYDFTDFYEDDRKYGKSHMMTLAFLLCGKFIAMPSDQIEIYTDADLYNKKIPQSLEVIVMSKDDMALGYDVDGLGVGIRFKHPVSHFEDKAFEKWDCGYVCGMTLVYY